MLANEKRASGVLLHITSLPSPFGIGDFGPLSRQFVDLLTKLKQQYWSILPISPTRSEYNNSPYKNDSAFAGNTLLISPEQLIINNLLPEDYSKLIQVHQSNIVDYSVVEFVKNFMLKKAYKNFVKNNKPSIGKRSFEEFCTEEKEWLDDFALFKALRELSGNPWFLWPKQLRDREQGALINKTENQKEQIEKHKFDQYIFFSQWLALKNYCNKMDVKIIGDMPFYVGYDSSDIWSNQKLFKLDINKKPQYIGGVPPDYFSSTGQLWGDPVYNWKELRKDKFGWWITRIRHNLKLYDLLRFDHFRGFVAYWQVSASEKNASKGKWIRAPAKSFFSAVKNDFPTLPFIAEDLGAITKSVEKTVFKIGLPGMRVLFFGFDGSKANPHLPENYTKNTVAYTGTHDTNTAKGWFKDEATTQTKKQISDYIGKQVSEKNINFELIKLASASKSNLCIIPFQDISGLDSKARMNNPAKSNGNWQWRATSKQLLSEKLDKFRILTIQYNR